MIGHYVGAVVAYFWLLVFDLVDAGSAIAEGFTSERVAAVALSVAFTGGILRLMRAAHPPAGATTVIVSAGLLTSGADMLSLFAGVALLTVAAGILNRLLGVPAPLWVSPYSGFYTRLRKRLGMRPPRFG